MKKILLIAIASIAFTSLCFTNCKKKADTTAFPNGTSWIYSIVANDVLPVGTITLNFTDKVSGTVAITSPAPKTTPIPATGYTYVEAAGTLIITGIDLSAFLGAGTPAIPLTGKFNAEKTTLTILIPQIGDVVFNKQ